MTAPDRGAELRYKEAAEALWQLLDDMSTSDDISRGDNYWFRRRVQHLAERRHEWAKSYDGQSLVWEWDE